MKRIIKLILFILISILPFLLEAQESKITTQNNDTLSTKIYKINNSKKTLGIVLPLSMLTYGGISLVSKDLKKLDTSTKNELTEDNYMLYNKIDNYMQFAPAVMAFGLKMGKLESTHKLSDMIILYSLSNILETGIVYSTKKLTKRKRPNGKGNNSFPSGHTATAFVAAEFLHQEYKHKSTWISISGYSIATLVGLSRIFNDKHWISDVVTGAGVGILSTKVVYWSYPYLQNCFDKKNKHQISIIPGYDSKNFSLNISCVL